jgi:hypothetical protein
MYEASMKSGGFGGIRRGIEPPRKCLAADCRSVCSEFKSPQRRNSHQTAFSELPDVVTIDAGPSRSGSPRWP